MSTDIRTAPEGYGTVTPWIVVRGVPAFLDYLAEVLDAEEIVRLVNEDGSVGHAEARIGDSVVMMFDAEDDWPDTPAFLRLYLEDADAVHARMVAAGGTSVTEMTELFFGERVGRVRDPWGNLWWLHTRVAELDEDEVVRRAQAPEGAAAMGYVQGSLREEMRGRAHSAAS